jgi:hypothetical protein
MFSLEFGALNSQLVHLYRQAAPICVDIMLPKLLIASLHTPGWVFYIVFYI